MCFTGCLAVIPNLRCLVHEVAVDRPSAAGSSADPAFMHTGEVNQETNCHLAQFTCRCLAGLRGRLSQVLQRCFDLACIGRSHSVRVGRWANEHAYVEGWQSLPARVKGEGGEGQGGGVGRLCWRLACPCQAGSEMLQTGRVRGWTLGSSSRWQPACHVRAHQGRAGRWAKNSSDTAGGWTHEPFHSSET